MKYFFAFCCVTFILSLVAAEEITTTFDAKPESGIPVSAQLQNSERLTKPLLWGDVFAGKIESVSIRYFDSETWKTKKQVRQYLIGFLKREDIQIFSSAPWAQGVGVPEIECSIKFKDEYRNSFDKNFKYGKLLIWNTVACFRDANGTWCFLTNGDYFHLHHPAGDPGVKAKLENRSRKD